MFETKVILPKPYFPHLLYLTSSTLTTIDASLIPYDAIVLHGLTYESNQWPEHLTPAKSSITVYSQATD